MDGALVPVDARIFPLLGPGPREAGLGRRRAPRSCIPGPMNRGVEIDSDVADDLPCQPDPGSGRDGRRRPHGGAGLAWRARLESAAMTARSPSSTPAWSTRPAATTAPARSWSRTASSPTSMRGAGRASRPTSRSSTRGGLCLAPGLIDIRVKTGEPGAEPKETLKSASLSAAAGGVTTIVIQPDTDPAVDDPAMVDFILRRGAALEPGQRPRGRRGDQGPRRRADGRDRPDARGRRALFHRRRPGRSSTAGCCSGCMSLCRRPSTP